MRYVVTLLATVFTLGFAQAPLEKRLDEDLSKYMTAYDLPGLAVSVLVDGEVVYAKAFGFRNLQKKTPMRVDSLFHMASVSKPFAATAIMQLVEQGKIDLDAPVITYLPYFKLESDSYNSITIREMLTHRSGMPDEDDYEWDKPQYDPGAAERYVRSIANEKPIAPRGAKFFYSNIAFDVLADVVQKVSGLTYEDYVKQQILDPLGMKHSTFLKPQVPESLATAPHVRSQFKVDVSDIYPYNRRHAPSSTLHSNVMEMARWARANMNRGSLDGVRILKADSYLELFKKQNEASSNRHVGLSWFISDFEGHQEIGHSGGDVGYATYFGMIPDKGIAITVLCNFDNVPIRRIRSSLLSAALGLPHDKVLEPVRTTIRRTIQDKGIQAAEMRYRKLRKEAPEAYIFGPAELYYLGYEFVEGKKLEVALALFKINVEFFPEHHAVQGALGELYLDLGQPTLAVKHLQESVRINPNNARRQKLLEDALKQQKK